MKNVVIITASPKMNPEESVSGYLGQMADTLIQGPLFQKTLINIRQSFAKQDTQKDYETIAKADALIIIFPLYIYCLPGILMRFLEDYYTFLIESSHVASHPKIYTVVNCGFPEPDINLEAVRVIKSFSQHIKAHFRLGILFGGGGFVLEAKDAPFMKKTLRTFNEAFSKIAEDIQNNHFEELENISVAVNFPRWLYLLGGNLGWTSQARKNGLKKKDLYRKPYQE